MKRLVRILLVPHAKSWRRFYSFGRNLLLRLVVYGCDEAQNDPMPTLSVRDSISKRATRLACSLLVVFLWRSGPGAQAEVIDCSDTSLRAAAGNGGSYFFDCGTNATTIALTNTIVVTADVTLDGAGQSIVISGGNAVRLFTINPGVNFTLKNLVLASGKAAGDDGTNGVAGGNAAGAGIYNDGGSVTLINCTLSGHAVTGGNGGNGVVQLNGSGGNGGSGGSASGGAIFNNAGALWLTNCTFVTNTASSGAGGNGADALAGGNGNSGGRGGDGGNASGGAIANAAGTVLV